MNNLFLIFYLTVGVNVFAQQSDLQKVGKVKIRKQQIYINTEVAARRKTDKQFRLKSKDQSSLAIDAYTDFNYKNIVDLNEYFKTNLDFRYPDTVKTLRVDTILVNFSVVENSLSDVGASVCRTSEKMRNKNGENDLSLESYKVVGTLRYWASKPTDQPVSANCLLKIYISNYNFNKYEFEK